MTPMTRIGAGGIEPSTHRLRSLISVVNDLGKPMLPEVVDHTLLARDDDTGVPAMAPIREIPDIAFQSALGSAVVESSRPWRLAQSTKAAE